MIAVDLFAGAGGCSTGLLAAATSRGERVQLTAVNHWPTAVETHTRNHPQAQHFCASIDTVDPRVAVPGGKLDLLIAAPECFPAGTLVLTDDGLTPIEDVTVGSMVMTHNGRWRSVMRVMESVRPTIMMKGQGHFGLETTASHPFWTRTRKKRWPRSNRNGEWAWSAPSWEPAGVCGGRFWATPTQFPAVPVDRLSDDWLPSDEFWWLVGRWLGDGSMDDRPGRGGSIQIACSDAEAEGLEPRLHAGLPAARWTRRRTRTAVLFETRSWDLVRWLRRNFGKLAHGKTLPAWSLSMPRSCRAALLAGYCSADGHDEGRKQDCITVSKRLAIGLRLLAESLGYRVSLYRVPQHATQIEGRRLTVRDLYRVKWTHDRKRNWHHESDAVAWSRVRSVIAHHPAVRVFNLSVDEDESYIADGLVVHNCTHHSTARGGKPINDQSRASAWHIMRWLELLKVDQVLIENVPEFQTWGPLDARNRRPLKSRKGETFRAFIVAMESYGYRVEWKVLNAADFGAATTRRRLFIRASRGRRPIAWPEPTHSRTGGGTLFGGRRRWRAAREVIDWSLPSQSIFGRKRPLKPATMRRILEGLRRFGGPDVQPFLVQLTHGGRTMSVDNPLPTLTTANRGEIGIAEPFILDAAFGEGDARRQSSIDEPIGAQPATNRFGLVQPFILGQQSGSVARSVREPVPTVSTDGAISLIEPYLTEYYGNGGAQSVDDPVPTVTTRDRFALVQPVLDGRALDIRFRMLQPHELSAAMSFPKGYAFAGNKGDTIRQIGNAVDCRMAEALCGAILDARSPRQSSPIEAIA